MIRYALVCQVMLVCRNTYLMLEQTRFREHFDFFDGNGEHHGIFEGCGVGIPFASARGEDAAGAKCC